MSAAGEQPSPTSNEHVDVQSQVIADIVARRELGIERYGTALQPYNGRDMLLDAYQEALDLAVYLRGELEERRLHMPTRGSDVEVYIKSYRDRCPKTSATWHVLNTMLDDYRLRADVVGSTLVDEEVEEG